MREKSVTACGIILVATVYWWADIDVKKTVIMRQVGVQSEAIVNWFNYIRDICAVWCVDHPMQIAGNNSVVEIDESNFMHRKFHRGRWHEGH